MKVKHRIYLQIFFLSCTFCIYCPPPPPPPLPGQLANQTLAQLMQVFGTSSALNNNSTTSGLALSMLSTTNAPSVISSNPTITTNAKMPSSSATGTTANGTKPSSASSVAQVSSLLSNQNSSLTTRANLALNRYTTAKGTPVKITPSNKYQMSQGAIALNQSFMTNFTGSTALQMPPLTFPDKNVAQAYSDFATALQSVPGFIMMFKKLHITALHELYLYLTGIYATLNLLNIADLKTYMVLEKTLGLNKKTLIISYMVDLIASQLTSTLQGCMPGMPQQVAIQAGIAAISNQGGNNINMLVLDMEQTVLGLLGMDPLTPTQVATLVSSLTSSANAQLIASNNTINQTDYQAALKIVSSSNINFVQQLSESQAEALMEAINTISDGIANAQQIASVQNIVNQLQAPNQAPVLSANDTQFFQQIVSQIAYGKPFSQVYSTVQSLAQKINTISATPLTAVECSTLISVISYLSLLFEQQLSSLTVSAIGQLNIKNPTQAVLSVGQQIKLQITASSMLTGSSPVQLISLNQNDRILLSQAFQIFSQNCPAGLTASQSSFSAIAQLLAQSAVDQKSLSSSQASALQAVLSYLNQFTFSSTTLAQAENAFSAADQTVIGQAITQINSASFTSFNQLSASQQQLVLAAFQQLDAVVQTRSALHTQDAALLQGLLQEDNTAIVSALNSLSMADYQNLSYLYDYLKGLQSAQTSISTMNTVYKSQTPSPIATLQTIFTPAKTGSTGESFIDLINQLNQQNNANSVIQQVIASLTPDQLTMYQAIAASLQKATIMQMSSLTSAQQQLFLSFFQPYLTSLQSS